MSALNSLRHTIEKVCEIQNMAARLKDEMQNAEAMLTHLCLGTDKWGSPNVPMRYQKTAGRARKLVGEQLIAEARQAHREALDAAALELESLRATLCFLASHATIEVGAMARDFAREARAS